MTKKQIVIYSITAVGVILFLILVFILFRSFRNRELNTHEEVIKARDATIEAIRDARKSDSLLIIEKDKSITILLAQDSIRNANYVESQKIYNRINEKIRNISVYVDRIGNDDDSLREAYRQLRQHTIQ